MLKRALLFESELTTKFIEVWDDLKYKYYFGQYAFHPELKEDTWNCHQYVSVNDQNAILGYIEFKVDECLHMVDSISLVSFATELADRMIVLVDLQKKIHELFYKYKYERISFAVFIGNPVEKFYDKYVQACGGRIAGYFRKDMRIQDGTFLDSKHYEILLEDYTKNVPDKDFQTGLLKFTDDKLINEFFIKEEKNGY